MYIYIYVCIYIMNAISSHLCRGFSKSDMLTMSEMMEVYLCLSYQFYRWMDQYLPREREGERERYYCYRCSKSRRELELELELELKLKLELLLPLCLRGLLHTF